VPRTKEFRRPGLQGDFDDLVMSSRFFRFMCAPRDAWTEMEVRRTNNDNFYMGSDDKYGGRQDDLLPIGGKGENGREHVQRRKHVPTPSNTALLARAQRLARRRRSCASW
jgi:hypothetical protein